jgi:hypothetical protein
MSEGAPGLHGETAGQENLYPRGLVDLLITKPGAELASGLASAFSSIKLEFGGKSEQGGHGHAPEGASHDTHGDKGHDKKHDEGHDKKHDTKHDDHPTAANDNKPEHGSAEAPKEAAHH